MNEYVVDLRLKGDEILAQLPQGRAIIKTGDQLNVEFDGDFGHSGWRLTFERYGPTFEDAKKALRDLVE